MKKFLSLSLALLSVNAFSQSYIMEEDSSEFSNSYERPRQEMQSGRVPAAKEGVRHMFSFGLDSIESAALSFEKIKTKGTDSDVETNLDLDLNYAYGIHPMLQVAARLNYFNGVNGSADEENLGGQVGAILNSNTDFTNSYFVAAYIGLGISQRFGSAASRDSFRTGQVAVGKRFSLEEWGLKHLTYSPEISFDMMNSMTGDSLDYSQSLRFKILQFSVFF